MQSISNYLKSLGVKTMFFGCGGRNESLLDYFDGFEQKLFIDERAGAFAALGQAKIKKQPVAFCVTSGTAVAECFPAVIEAYYSQIPLIIISADRPERLQGTNAPQTINQKHIFGKYSRTYIDLNIEDEIIRDEVFFPMHLNIKIDDSKLMGSLSRGQEVTSINAKELHFKLESASVPLIYICENSQVTDEQIKEWDSHNYLLYVESLSNHNDISLKNRVYFDKQIRAMLVSKEIDLVVKVGNTPVSGIWRDLDREFVEVDVISINSEKTGLARGFLAAYPELLPKKKHKNLPRDLRNELDHLCKKFPESEHSIFKNLTLEIPLEDIVFLGNSMPIRLWQLMNSGHSKIYGNRGANGIDGQLSTAIGIAYGTNKTVHCILGDLTFLYDMTMIMDIWPSNLKLSVINNQGGGIFRRVAVNPRMVFEHDIDLKGLISLSPNFHRIEVFKSDNLQTEAFWNEWQEI